MWALLSPRLWIAIVVAGILAASHFGAYRSGKATVRAEWDKDVAERTAAALQAEQKARAKEQILNAAVADARSRYAIQVKNVHSVAGAAADGMRQLQQALAGPAAAASATATARTDDAARARIVVGDCARVVQKMAAVLDEREQQLIGLQEYVKAIK